MYSILILILILGLWTYFLYPVFLYLISLIHKNTYSNDENYKPKVSIVIVAHNEEKVIEKTIQSCLNQDYPREKFDIVVASDHSTDLTNEIAISYLSEGVRLIKTRERKGRANAHNEACSSIDSEIIAFCDANTIWNNNTLSELVLSLSDAKVGFVTGQLSYINVDDNQVSKSEGVYWKYELILRKLESQVSNVTAGNGAVYAIKKSCYEPINPLYSHDIVLPSMVVKKGFKSIYNNKAMAYEYAGETTQDEYARKVRMFGRAWHFVLRNFQVFNPFKVGPLYSVCMISHRFLRYCSGVLQFLFFVISIILLAFEVNFLNVSIFSFQFIFYITIYLSRNGRLGKVMYTIFYLNLFHLATLVGFFNAITNRVKPFWLSPQSTRK